MLYVNWFCFSKKIASRRPCHYLLTKMLWSLHKNRQGLPDSFVNLIFNLIFYVSLCKSLCISNVPAVFFIKRVLVNLAKLTKGHVYMRPKTISNRFEISNHFEKSLCPNNDFTAATFQTIVWFYCTCANDKF